MGDIFKVEISTQAKKEIKKVPTHISVKLLDWIESVEEHGLSQVRKIPGFHDEPLKGNRKGQRSIRLSKAYRAIYIESFLTEKNLKIEIVIIEEVNKHDY